MFNKILIKSGSNVAERYLSIADVVDMMFYFNEVHVVISQLELKQLLAVFGEDIFYELITSKRLIAHLCDQHIGASKYGELDSVGLFRPYTDDFNYQVRELSKEEIDFLNHSTFYKFGVFDFILPQSVENDFEDIPFIDRLYRRLYFPVWDKNSKYKHGDIVSVDENSQVIYSKSDACLILI